MERELRDSENRYRSLFDNMSSGVAIYKAIEDGNDFIIKGFNKAAENIEQVNAAEIIGKKVTEVFPGIEEMGLMDVLRSTWNAGTRQFLPATFYSDGRISGWRENFVYRLSNGEIVAVYNDVSEKINDEEIIRQTEEKLRKSEEKYRIMFENASDIITVLDSEMRSENVTDNLKEILGYERDELNGKSVLDWIHPEDADRVRMQFETGFARGEGIVEYRFRHKDGHYIWLEAKGKIFTDLDGQKKALILTRDISENIRIKQELIELNQELEQRVEERTRDLKETQEKLMRQEKFAAVGKVSGIISHELRNPLATISNSIYYLNMKLGNTDEKIQKHVKLIQTELDRSRKIITDLLNFTRMKQLEFTRANLMAVIRDSLNHVAVPDGITVQVIDNAGDLQLDIDPDLIQQAFINIITNAIQAMSQDGSLCITIGYDEERVTVAFKDTGIGIPPENIQKLFEPLFTTKKSGIGLGLAYVKDIIDKHGGEIQVESTEGIGTTFTIFLPSIHSE